MPDATQFPPRLLSEAIWRFWEDDPYEDQSIFTARMTEHGRRVIEPGPYDWAPDTVAIRTPRLRVKYFGGDPEDDFEYANYEVTLASSDGREFTNRELLFKLHKRRSPAAARRRSLLLRGPGAGRHRKSHLRDAARQLNPS